MADVFLSYGRSSLGWARRISEALEASGFDVWFDEDLPAHRPYSDVIEEQLEKASAVVVLWSREAIQSQWVRSEANRARETGRLVQVRLDDARLPMPFDQIQCADLRTWGGKKSSAAWDSVLASVGALAGREGSATLARHPARGITRRNAIIAASATATVAIGGFALWRVTDGGPSPEARLLLQKGLDSLQSNDALEAEGTGSTAQAIALLTDATEADPTSATAWGALALAYAIRRRGAQPAERQGLEARTRSAAASALELDEHEPRALAALRLVDPVYRNWLNAERAAREALSHHPRHPILLFVTSDILGSVGRWKEAAQLSDRLDRTKFLIPGADRKVIVNQWSAGNLQAADKAVQVAVEHWPDHPQIWRTHMAYLMFSGRPLEMLGLLRDQSNRPAGLEPGLVDALEATGLALAGRSDAQAALSANLSYLRQNAWAASRVAQACAALGHLETALSILNGYYFADGEWASVAPPGGDEDRHTASLFQPPMDKLRSTPQFDALLERIGITAYWSASRTLPDYRRVA